MEEMRCWLSKVCLSILMRQLDDKYFIEKWLLAQRQTKRRIVGTPSNHPVPYGNVHGWDISKN